jgi:membrane dipeptidase
MSKIRPFVPLLLAFPIIVVLAACRAATEPPSVEARARDFHRRILTVDTHCDTAFNLLRTDWRIGDRHDPALRGSGKLDLPRMISGGLDAEFFAVFVGQGPRTPEGYAKAKESALKVLDAIEKMARDYPDLVGLASAPRDAYRLKRAGKRIAFIGLENGYPIGRDLSLVASYYGRGVRYLTLVHSADNDLCDSSTDRREPADNGLTPFGGRVVAECNRLGMMIDISHASEKSFFDVLAATRAPIIASHSCARALSDNPRNLTDDELRALARNGGVIQICFLSAYVKKPDPNPERDQALRELQAKYGRLRDVQDEALRSKARAEYEDLNRRLPESRATVSDLVDHIDHVRKTIGIDYVGLGTDFDGGGGVVGCDDVGGMIHVTEEMIRRGYTEKEIEKVWGANIMRVFDRVIAAASK